MSSPSRWWHKRWTGNLLWIVAAIVLFFGIRAWQQQAMPKGTAPPIVGETVSGKTVSLSDYRGKPLMLYFWASWCRICELEQESIRSIARGHAVLSVALRSGNALQLGKYMREHEFHITAIVDEFGLIANSYGVKGTPTAFFIDAEGKIRSVEVGYTSEVGMRIRLWLAGL